jgi:CubicO group peptidase (beta-lactamase class C family)
MLPAEHKAISTLATKPEEVGLSSARLTRIDEHLRRRYIEPGKLAGCLTLVARHGKIAFLSSLGMSDLERTRPMADDTIFRIYSMSKPITSVALMSFYEEGHFQLDDPVHKFIPEWSDLRVYAGGNHPAFLTRPCERPMTIRDLMTHMSGLTYGFMERTNVDAAYRKLGVGNLGPKGTLRDMIDSLAELPLEFSPGTRWNYSVATDVLGYLVEVFSGQPFDVVLRERVLGPLGMIDTGFDVPAASADRLAANYDRRRDKTLRLIDDPATSSYTKPTTFFSGGGGLVSTAADYHRFCQMLLNGGELEGTRILGRKTVELMTMNHLPGGRDLTELSVGAFSETTYEGNGFGLGFSITLDLATQQGIGSPGDYGWGGAASTIFWIDPAEDLIVIFLTQFMPSATFNFRGQLKSIVYPAIID